MRRDRPAVLVAGVSGSIFLLEILLTRIFSVTLFHHFAFAAISMGMLGLAAAGVRVALAPARFTPERLEHDVASATVLFGATTTAAVVVLVRLGVFPAFSWGRLVRLLVVYALCVVPFYFGGLVLTLLFTHHRERFARLYAADLAAAGVAGLLVFPLLRGLGGPAAVAAAVVLALLALLAAYPALAGTRRQLAWATAVAATLLIAGDGAFGWLRLRGPKEAAPRRLLYEAWNAFSRVAVHAEPMAPWSLAPTWDAPFAPGLAMDIDANAATPIIPAAPVDQLRYLQYELTAVGHVVSPRRNALVIGSGGGRDVVAALLWGVPRVDAVEINPIIVNDVMRGRFRDFTGRLYDDPRVAVHVGDGRSFVRRSRERYDLIQLSMVDTWAAVAAGAFALSENNLYTVEAVREYIDRLADDGILTFTRWAGGEAYRLVLLVDAAARDSGIREPHRHVAVLQHHAARGGENVAVTLLFRRRPFDEPAIAALRSHVAQAGFFWLHDPLAETPGRIAQIVRAADPLGEARKSEDYELTPSTDDRPFFFYRPRPFLAGILESPARVFVEGQYLVSAVLVFATFLGGAAILLPLYRGGREALRAEPGTAWRAVPYFAALGLGFMLVEVSMMQRFVLYLGHPTHALTVVVTALLVGAGLGSAWAGRWRPESAARAAAGTVALLLGAAALVPLLFAATGGAGFAAKVLLAALVVAPLGAAMGTLMPLGMAHVARRAPGLVPWAWGVNGFFSVVGACGAALGSMTFGFRATFAAGVACYVLAAILARPFRAPDERAIAVPAAEVG